MVGSNVSDDEWEFPSAGSNDEKTLVLVGRAGNGKSATGNSIIGKEAFKSEFSSAGVTTTCEQQHTIYNGQMIKVIDTPGLFDSSKDSELIGKELVKCINLAKEGIHAVLLVFSIRTRFSREEEEAVRSLCGFFGNKLIDYMIVVFTGGDDLARCNMTLDDYLGRNRPDSLKEVLRMCGNRKLLFDNTTEDETKKESQLRELVRLVNVVVDRNGGKPYTNEIFSELREQALLTHSQAVEWDDKPQRTYDAQFERIIEMVEAKLRETTRRLEEQLVNEKMARFEAEMSVRRAQWESKGEICKLRESLERAEKETEKLRREAEEREVKFRNAMKESSCSIL